MALLIWIIVALLIGWSILVALDNGAAGGWIFDRGRWPYVLGAWVLLLMIWLGSGAYGVWSERNMYRSQVQETIKNVEPRRNDIIKATGIDPLAAFKSDSSDSGN
jgi:hypothetical protein